jgi:AsmA protein
VNRTLRISLIVGAVVVAALMVAPFLFSVNQFRPVIEQQASAALGRRVDLGRLHLSLLRGSVSADSLAVSDDPAFSNSPFLTARSVTVGVEIWPLIRSRSLNVTSLRIEQPAVTLIRNSAGQWNYASLGSSGSASSAFSIKKLELNDGRMVVGRASQKRQYDHVNVTAA